MEYLRREIAFYYAGGRVERHFDNIPYRRRIPAVGDIRWKGDVFICKYCGEIVAKITVPCVEYVSWIIPGECCAEKSNSLLDIPGDISKAWDREFKGSLPANMWTKIAKAYIAHYDRLVERELKWRRNNSPDSKG